MRECRGAHDVRWTSVLRRPERSEDSKPFARVEGGSHHRVKGEAPCQCPEVKPLGRVQGGSACWVSRGQSPMGRVQGDNACSGVQRVKPSAQ